MGSEEYESYRKRIEEEKQKIKLGYQRVKEKVKSVRQDYRNAVVNKGTRRASGKVVQDNYDLLTDIWGGSPSTTFCLSALMVNIVKLLNHRALLLIWMRLPKVSEFFFKIAFCLNTGTFITNQVACTGVVILHFQT